MTGATDIIGAWTGRAALLAAVGLCAVGPAEAADLPSCDNVGRDGTLPADYVEDNNALLSDPRTGRDIEYSWLSNGRCRCEVGPDHLPNASTAVSKLLIQCTREVDH